MSTLPIDTPRQAGLYVRRARERQGMTRAQTAQRAGVSERLLASLELGDATGIRLDKLLAVFSALDISLMAGGDLITERQALAPAASKTSKVPLSSTIVGQTLNSPIPPTAKTMQQRYDDLYRSVLADMGITPAATRE